MVVNLDPIQIACSSFWLRLSPYLAVAALLAAALFILVRRLRKRSQGCAACSSCSACALNSCPSRQAAGKPRPAVGKDEGAPHGHET